jgi:hypothetical protein
MLSVSRHRLWCVLWPTLPFLACIPGTSRAKHLSFLLLLERPGPRNDLEMRVQSSGKTDGHAIASERVMPAGWYRCQQPSRSKAYPRGHSRRESTRIGLRKIASCGTSNIARRKNVNSSMRSAGLQKSARGGAFCVRSYGWERRDSVWSGRSA